MQQNKKTNRSLILILGSLTALSPFSIDMYLSAFPQMAQVFNTNVTEISLTLSSYFIGLASGQLFYGPIMDRFGRKKPLYIGLLIYIFASIACAFSPSLNSLIFFRFLQAAGGCAASVGAFAMVRDLFDPKESAKVLSMLILILGVSPLLAPTIGGYLAVHLGWASVFIALAMIAAAILSVVFLKLPESHMPDTTHILRPLPIIKNYFSIFREPQFYTYALAGAVGFSALFVYLAASPTIFMEIFQVTEQTYGWIFAIIAMGMIGMSQVNVLLIKKFSNEQILFSALVALLIASIVFFICSYMGWFNLYSVVATIFVFLCCIGLSNPNAAALSMAPFGRKAGSAAALIGFLQMSVGALASVCVGLLKGHQLFPIAGIFVGTSSIAVMILIWGSRNINNKVKTDPTASDVIAH